MSFILNLFQPAALFDFRRRPAAPPAWAGQWRRPCEVHPERLFLHVRAVEAPGYEHLFQFALARDDGEIAASVHVRGRDADSGGRSAAPLEPPVPILDWLQLAQTLDSCRGGWVVAFGRVLHGAFLPPETRQAIDRLDCARARFLKVAKRRGVRVRPGDVGDLNDARRLIGLPPVRSPDAAAQALGLRELWRWMDWAEG